MPTSNSPYPTAPLALLIDATNDRKSINNNCNGAVHESNTRINTDKFTYRQPTERAGEKSRRTENKMNLQVVCITVTLVICCIVITGLEVSNRAVSSSYYQHLLHFTITKKNHPISCKAPVVSAACKQTPTETK